MGRTPESSLKPDDIFAKVILTSFENPAKLSNVIEGSITKNRNLNSATRRELANTTHAALRWRRRLWSEAPSGHIAMSETQEKLAMMRSEDLKNEKWDELTADECAEKVSFPTWIISLWRKYYSAAEVASIALSMNKEAPVCLRTNLLRNSREALAKSLLKEGIETHAGHLAQTALYVDERKNIRGTEAFKKGAFDMQDEASQKSVELADVSPGKTVLDACARTGGKSLALAALMQNKGKLLACDIDARTLDTLQQRAKRAGVTCVQTLWVAPGDPDPLGYLKTQYDAVYVDAPCSGLGVLRRKSFAKWLLKPEDLESFPGKQLPILEKYSRYVKPKGTLLYATCTLNFQENQNIVANFLSKQAGHFYIHEAREFRPDVHNTDGFFVAALKRAG